jgi:CHAT domain-containing protein
MTWRVAAAVAVVSVTVACTQVHKAEEAEAAKAIAALFERGEYNAAETAARQHVAAIRRVSGERSLETLAATDLLVAALVLNGRGSSEEARRLAAQALEKKQQRLGAGDEQLVPSLRNLSQVVADSAGKGAVDLLTRALAIQEQGGSAPPVDRATTLTLLSLALERDDRIDEAVREAERSVAITEKLDGRAHARSLEALVRALQSKGDYDRAGSRLDQALELRRSRDDTHPEFIETMSLLSFQESARGRFEEAHRAAETAVAMARHALRPDHPTTARALRLLAGATRELWDLAGALAQMEQALSMAERGLGPSHPEISTYLNSLANLRLLAGDYESARSLYDRSLAIREAAFGQQHDMVGTVVYNLALVDANLGDFERARQEYQRAITIWEGVYGSEHVIVARALAAQAEVIRSLGRPAEAQTLFERALAIQERSLGAQHRSVAITLKELAETLRQMHRGAEAWPYIERAQRVWIARGSPDDREYAALLALAAEVRAEQGALDVATRAYDRAVAMFERVFGSDHPEVAQVRLGLARTLARTAQKGRALSLAEAAEQSGREHLRLMLRSLPERQALGYAEKRPRGVDLMVSLVGETATATPAAIDAVIRSRALVLDEVAARRRAALAASGIDSRVAALRTAQQRLANLLVQGPGSMPRARYEALLDATRRQGEAAEREAATSSAAFRQAQTLSQAGLAEVMQALPPETALISYVRFERQVTRPGARGAEALGIPSYLGFILRPGRDPVAVPLGSSSAIDDDVASWRRVLAAEALEARTDRRSSDQIGQELRRRIWDPLAAHLAGSRTVLVVADGALGLLPLSALPARSGGYLVEDGPSLHYLTAERDVIGIGTPRAAPMGLLALGGPTFDEMPAASDTLRGGSAPCDSLQSTVFGPLDGTRAEVQEIAGLWPQALGVPEAHIGAEASEPLLKREAHRHRVIHLATHGFFLGGPCAPALPTGTRGVGGLSSATEHDNSLRLSGLAFAGANRRAQTKAGEDDGILTAEEVVSLDLSGTEWAVLSACDTGVGEIKAGEGVFGLRRAFQVAGARTVIMSLWSVEDQSTRAWMRALYEGRFQRHLSTAEAVHQASLTVLRDRRARGVSTHPFFWAAFVAAGDWR